MCKMLFSLEKSAELEMFQSDVAQICDAMLAFPLNLPSTMFRKGLKVINSMNFIELFTVI